MKIGIVGAGASGLLCAILCRERGFEVQLFERNDRVGKKLLATGNGRCNFTNIDISRANYHGANPKFVYSALKGFDQDDVRRFFYDRGVPSVALELGKVYPRSLEARTVVDCLLQEALHLGVVITYEAMVEAVTDDDHGFTLSINQKKHRVDRLVLATGGKAHAKSGSDGNGYVLAQSLGHEVSDVHPGIVQLALAGEAHKGLSGSKVNGIATLYREGEKPLSDRGDLLFTDYGISGPPILQLSSKALSAVRRGDWTELGLDFLPEYGVDQLRSTLYGYREGLKHRTASDFLNGLIPRKIGRRLMSLAGYTDKHTVSQLREESVELVIQSLKDWRFSIAGPKSEEDGQVSCGGVVTDRVNPKTMASRDVDGLYVIGELLDVDGDCGGYNLQWAWSSAYACATHLGRRRVKHVSN